MARTTPARPWPPQPEAKAANWRRFSRRALPSGMAPAAARQPVRAKISSISRSTGMVWLSWRRVCSHWPKAFTFSSSLAITAP